MHILCLICCGDGDGAPHRHRRVQPTTHVEHLVENISHGRFAIIDDSTVDDVKSWQVVLVLVVFVCF